MPGVHWEVIVNRTQGTISDCSRVFYNPFREKWVFSIKTNIGYGVGRARGMDNDDTITSLAQQKLQMMTTTVQLQCCHNMHLAVIFPVISVEVSRREICQSLTRTIVQCLRAANLSPRFPARNKCSDCARNCAHRILGEPVSFHA